MKISLVSKCFLDIEQYVEFKVSVLISPSKSLISSRWDTYIYTNHNHISGKKYKIFVPFQNGGQISDFHFASF